jgi:hypothetical protein
MPTEDWKFGDILKIDPNYMIGIAYHERRAMFIEDRTGECRVVALKTDYRESAPTIGYVSAINPRVWVKDKS